MPQTPNPPVMQHFKGGGMSGEGWIRYKRWRHHLDLMVKSYWGQHCCHTGGPRPWHPQEGANENAPGLVEKQNKKKHGNNWHNQQNSFPLFVIYVNGMVGKESLVVIMDCSRIFAEKWRNPFCKCVYRITVG